MTPLPVHRLVHLAAAWAVLMLGVRLYILARFGQWPAAEYVAGVLLGMPAEFLIGGAFAAVLFNGCRGPACRWTLVLVLFLVAVVRVGAFHYEAVFHRMPSLQLLFYLGELDALSASLATNVPLSSLALELGIIAAALVALVRWSRPERVDPGVRGASAALVMGLVVVAAGVNAAGNRLPDKVRNGSREPLIALVQSALVRDTYQLEQLHLSDADFVRFLELHGNAAPGPVLDPRYPLCRPRPGAATGAVQGRSLIILVLESVGLQEVRASFRGEPLMPNLARLAQDGFTFQSAHAPGIKSIQTLTSLFSGMPPSPFNYYLWQTPLPHFEGWPAALRARGYATAYFHGGDLAFERQRTYLQAVGFSELHELDPGDTANVHGWGHDDATMFDRLMAWVDGERATGAPYLATLFTLSTHDPYLVPPGWTPAFSSVARQLREPGRCCDVIGETDTSVALAETYRFLDAQVGRFREWYEQQTPRPLLLVLGDHAPYVVKAGAATRNDRLRFDIPVILAGLAGDEEARLAPFRDAPFSVHDLPVLLSRLTGVPPNPCFAGPDLMLGTRGPEVAYAIGPESLQYVHLWREGREYVLDRARNSVSVLDADGASVAGVDTRWVQEFTRATFPVHYYLMQKDAWFPRRGDTAGMRPLPAVSRPLFAAHRANVDGPRSAPEENSRAALARVAETAIEWVEVDVQLTADGIPVLSHDATLGPDPIASLALAELRARPAGAGLMTLEEALTEILPRKKLLIELKAQARLQDQQRLVQAVTVLLDASAAGGRVIIDSFDEYLASSIKLRCRCEVGLDMPYQRPVTDADLAHVRGLGLDWIYVEQAIIDADLVQRAHAHGLKVMAYTVNEGSVIARWRGAGALPDGIITDHVALAGAD